MAISIVNNNDLVNIMTMMDVLRLFLDETKNDPVELKKRIDMLYRIKEYFDDDDEEEYYTRSNIEGEMKPMYDGFTYDSVISAIEKRSVMYCISSPNRLKRMAYTFIELMDEEKFDKADDLFKLMPWMLNYLHHTGVGETSQTFISHYCHMINNCNNQNSEYEKALKYLIGKGAKANIPDSTGLLPLKILSSIDYEYYDNPQENQELCLGVSRIIRLLVKDGGAPLNSDLDNTSKCFGINMLGSALHMSAIYESKYISSTLVELGADINNKNTDGKIPLHVFAEGANSLDGVKQVCTFKTVFTRRKDGKLPIQVIGEERDSIHYEICQESGKKCYYINFIPDPDENGELLTEVIRRYIAKIMAIATFVQFRYEIFHDTVLHQTRKRRRNAGFTSTIASLFKQKLPTRIQKSIFEETRKQICQEGWKKWMLDAPIIQEENLDDDTFDNSIPYYLD